MRILCVSLLLVGSFVAACSSSADPTSSSSSTSSSSGGSSSSSGGASSSSSSSSGGVTSSDPRQQAIRARCEKANECGQLGDATVEKCVDVFQANPDPTEFLACMAQQSCTDHKTPSQVYEGLTQAQENCSQYIDDPTSGTLCGQRPCNSGGDCPIECGAVCTDKGSGKTCGY